MGKRRKIAIEKRETPEQRAVTFCKRRQGLFNKAAHLCMLCDAQVALLVSKQNNFLYYSFGHPSVDAVVDAFFDNRAPVAEDNEVKVSDDNTNNKKKGKRSKAGSTEGFWWELEELDKYQSAEELGVVIDKLEKLKDNVMMRLNNNNEDGSNLKYLQFLDEYPDFTIDLITDILGEYHTEKKDDDDLIVTNSTELDSNLGCFDHVVGRVYGNAKEEHSYLEETDSTSNFSFLDFLDVGSDVLCQNGF